MSVTKAGLEDVVVSTSDICFIDGREGRLLYRGFDVDDLAEHSSFEEVVYLLWYGALPDEKQLDEHVKALRATVNRKLPPRLVTLLGTLPRKTTPMEVLRTGTSALSAFAYKSMGIPTDQFTPIFAISRVSGWAAHMLEQHGNNRLIRPRSEYTGPARAEYIPLDRR